MYRQISPVVVVLSALVLASMAFTELTAQELHYGGGAVKGIQVKTNPSLVETSVDPTLEKAGPFGLLLSSDLTVHVNAGESDLFVYEFDAQCGAGNFESDEDFVDWQARVNGFVRGIIGGPAFLQPQTVPTSLSLCRGPILSANAVAKSWVTRLSGGSEGADYTFTIWWRVIDQYPASPGVKAWLRNRIVKLTRYN